MGQIGGQLTTAPSGTQLVGTHSSNKSDVGTAQLILGTGGGLTFSTTAGYQLQATTSELTTKTTGSLSQVTLSRKSTTGTATVSLNVYPATPTKSTGTISYTQVRKFSGYFDMLHFVDSTTLKGTASDGRTVIARFNDAKKQVTLEYDGRSMTLTPQTYKAVGGSTTAVFKYTATGLTINCAVSGGYGYLQITENRTEKGSFSLRGQASSTVDTSSALYALHTDQLATVYAITDEQKKVVWAGEHDAFGQVQTTVSLLDNPLRFPGQYADAETGLYYNWHRYYNPQTGRYISSDPIGLVGGLNTFGYVGQNPTGWVDDDGLNRRGGSPYTRGRSGNPYGVPSLGTPVNMRDVYRAQFPPAWLRFPVQVSQQQGSYSRIQPQPRSVGNACRPESSAQYSVLFETNISSSLYPGRSERAHFQAANQSLFEAMRSDPGLARMMESLSPGIGQGLQPGPRGAYPRHSPSPDLTWHHGLVPGQMQLIRRSQHESGGAVQNTLHPNNQGGMSIWGGGR